MAFVGKSRSFVLGRCQQYGDLYALCPDEFKDDREIALLACSSNGEALEYATEIFQNDREIVMVACSNCGRSLGAASAALRGDKEIVLLACENDDNAFGFATDELKMDREFVMKLCSKGLYGCLQYCQESFTWDKTVIRSACRVDGASFQHADERLRMDKQFVLDMCQINGKSFQYATDNLRMDKQVALVAVASAPEVLKYALDGLNQDKDCLIAAGIWDDNHHQQLPSSMSETKKLIVLSTKFSLAAKGSAHATRFTVELKRHPYIRNVMGFAVYSPNAFNKETCDPDWTNLHWPCRGTFSTCQKPAPLKQGYPRDDCCWRYSFRYHLQRAKTTKGCMIQVVDFEEREEVRLDVEENFSYDWFLFENHVLGLGQTIETEMAEQEGTKVFRFFEPDPRQSEVEYSSHVDKCVAAIATWYEHNCQDMSCQDIGANADQARNEMEKIESQVDPIAEIFDILKEDEQITKANGTEAVSGPSKSNKSPKKKSAVGAFALKLFGGPKAHDKGNETDPSKETEIERETRNWRLWRKRNTISKKA